MSDQALRSLVSEYEARRQEALALYDLDDRERPELESLVELAASACGVPMATINVLTPDEQVQVASVGFKGSRTPRADSMCACVIDDGVTTVVGDARDDQRFQDNVWVTGPASVRFYASHPLMSSEGVPIGTLCVFDDQPRELTEAQETAFAQVGERVMAMLELERQHRRLRENDNKMALINDKLLTFAQTVSHDLRTPLTAIDFALALVEEDLADEAVPDRILEILGRARRRAERMVRTIDHLLAHASANDVDRVPVAWDAVVHDVLDDLHGQLDVLELEVADDLPTVTGDRDSLRLIVQNLLINAARYAAPHDPRVHIRTAEAPEGHRAIAVLDHGPGIPGQDAERIFARGERGPEAAGADQGFGIGLATCDSLVERMGGTLAVAVTPGGGATFTVTLPEAG